jgi:hypothetical protein
MVKAVAVAVQGLLVLLVPVLVLECPLVMGELE